MKNILTEIEFVFVYLMKIGYQFPVIKMFLKVIGGSIVLGESFRFLMGFLINGKISKNIKQTILHMKAVIISTVICPYVYITFQMLENDVTDIRDFKFVLLLPLCVLMHIGLIYSWRYLVDTVFKKMLK